MRVSENDKGSLSLTVRALAQLTGTAPDVIFRDAIGQAHRFALLPNEEPCIYGLLEQYHFIRQNTALEQKTLGELTAYMEENCMPGTVALVQFRFCGRAFFPVSADVDGNYRMGVVQIMGDRELRSVWLRWPDLEDHSLSRRRHRNSRGDKERFRAPRKYEDTPFFHYFQPNPRENCIGDCVLRAIAGACEISWDEALDRLASFGYGTVNGYDVYPRVMLDQGFTWHPKLTVNGRRLHGTEFCQELAALYRNGERILCEVGTQHVAAVLPGGKGDHISYQFWDSWNSSMSRDLIGDYYVKRPSGKSPGFGVERELQTGDTILHPSFGPGRLTGINDRGIWTVVFEKGVEKKLSGEWLRKNCSLAPEAGNSGVIG